MLKVWFGHDCPFEPVKLATGFVATMMQSKDFTNPFIREMIKAIDNVDTDEEGRMYHPIFGAINHGLLSNGLCGLIIAYKTDYPIDITRMGDNCLPWLLKISECKDVKCQCNRIPQFSQDFTFQDLESGDILHTSERFAAYALHKFVYEKMDDQKEYWR